MNLFQAVGLCIAGVVGYVFFKKMAPQPILIPVRVQEPVRVVRVQEPAYRLNLYNAEFSNN